MSDQNNNISLLADIGGTFCRFSIIHDDIPDLKDYKKYSKKYLNDENYAKDEKLGIWKGTFTRPEKWRKLN